MANIALTQKTLDLQAKAVTAAGAAQDAAAKVESDTGSVTTAQAALDAAKAQLSTDTTALAAARAANDQAALAFLQSACVDLGVDFPVTIPAPAAS